MSFFTKELARRASPLHGQPLSLRNPRHKKVTLTVTTRNGEERCLRHVWGDHLYVRDSDVYKEQQELAKAYPDHYVFINR